MTNRDPIERHAADRFTLEVDGVAARLLNELAQALRLGDLHVDDIGVIRVEHMPAYAFKQRTGPCDCQRLIKTAASGWEVQHGR